MNVSGILTDCLHIEKTDRRSATHFILCNEDKIRYIIDLKDGKTRLRRNIKSYSNKLYILMKLIHILPLRLFQLGKLGYFAKVVPCEAVQRNLFKTETNHWNVIVGTYDEKQKLVFQCFSDGAKTQYVKVGNKNTEVEMKTEIEYLKAYHEGCSFVVPQIVGYEMATKSCPFTIQITEEFLGEKVEPILTEDIIKLYQSICSKDIMFSHGDFAPWNIRKEGSKYVLFDWEHCGKRIEGYDIAYFVTVIRITLKKQPVEIAFQEGVKEIKKYLPDFEINKDEFMESFRETVKQLVHQ